MSAEDLRSRLTNSAEALDAKFTARIAIVEWWRPWAAGAAVLGALVAGVSRLVTGDLSVAMAVGGTVAASMCGLAIVLMDYKKLEISSEAKAALKVADESIGELLLREAELAAARSDATDAASRATAFDAKRNARIDAIRLMIEVVEAASLKRQTAASAAVRLLKIAAARVRDAVDYRAEDFFTLTIFKRTVDPAGGERISPIAREWTDAEASAGGRSWKAGYGYTGVLWALASTNRNASIVEPDTTLAAARQTYPVDNADPAREERYRSVAGFPITIGPDDDIWGIVTATSSRAGVFDHKGDLARQSVEMVRDVALVAGLLAKLDTRA